MIARDYFMLKKSELFDLVKHPSFLSFSHRKKLRENLTFENINQVDEQGLTLLHYAAQNDNNDFFKMIIGAGANPNILSFKNQSVLDIAFSNKNKENIQLLLEKGAEMTVKNQVNQTLLVPLVKIEYANLERHWIRTQRVLSSDEPSFNEDDNTGFKWPPILHAIAKYVLDCQKSNKPTLGLFTELFYMLSVPSRISFLPLDAYVEMGISLTYLDRAGFTPLDRACSFACIPALDWLIEKGLRIPEEYDVSASRFLSTQGEKSIFDFKQRFNYHAINQIKQSLNKVLPKNTSKPKSPRL